MEATRWSRLRHQMLTPRARHHLSPSPYHPRRHQKIKKTAMLIPPPRRTQRYPPLRTTHQQTQLARRRPLIRRVRRPPTPLPPPLPTILHQALRPRLRPRTRKDPQLLILQLPLPHATPLWRPPLTSAVKMKLKLKMTQLLLLMTRKRTNPILCLLWRTTSGGILSDTRTTSLALRRRT